MTIESGIENAGAYIDTLDDTYPAGTDDLSEGDNHVRGIKNCLLNTFPAITGPITSTHTELNLLDGATVTTAEINYNDITTLGTVQASKTVTANGSGHVTFNTGSAEKRIYFDATSVGTANSYLYGQPDGDIGAYDTTNGRDIFVYSEANSNFIIGSALTLKANTITATTGNGDLNLVRNGTGEITVDTTETVLTDASSINGSQLVSGTVDTTQLAAGAVQRAKIQTGTVSLSGTIPANDTVLIAMSPYSFFPMIHAVDADRAFVAGHTTDGASPDNARFSLYNQTGASTTYDVEYRYIDV